MTALTKERARSFEKWNYRQFTLASGNKAYKGAAIGIDLSTGKVEPAHAESDLFLIGIAAETVDATSADKLLNVDLQREIHVEYFVNQGGAIAAANVGSLCYTLDDQTVTLTPTGCVAGRIWAVDSARGVGVEKLQSAGAGGGGGGLLTETDAGAFAANDLVIAASPAGGAVYDIPTTAGASTVTLPAAAAEGTALTFVADGVKNGHTVQYRDATGPANLTTALTASKRHQVHVTYLNGRWTANAYVSP